MSTPTVPVSVPHMGNGSYDQSAVSEQPSHTRPFSQPPPTSQQGVLSQPTPQPQQHPRSVKRPRPVKSCTECRKRKLKCDRTCPCSQCLKSSRPCRYSADQDGRDSDGSDAETNNEGGGARAQKRTCHPTPTDVSFNTPGRNGDGPVAPVTFEDLVLRIERLENNALARSPTRAEMGNTRAIRMSAAAPDTIRGLSVKKDSLQTRFFGQGSTRVLLNLFDEARHYLVNFKRMPSLCDVFTRLEALQRILREQHRVATTPMTVFVDSMLPIRKRMSDIMPSKPVCDRLLASYIETNEINYRILHLPTFTAQYSNFWDKNRPQPDYFLPQLLAALAIGTRFIFTKSEGGYAGAESREGVHIPTAYALVRTWLDGLRGKHKIDFTTLQTEVLLLHANRLMSLVKPHDTWSQMGYVVRMAMTMGMHRDPDEFEELSPFQGELRRRLWYTIVDMDVYISLACNLPCTVREGDYTCRPPRNLDDRDLHEGMAALRPGRPIEDHTDSQIQVYACLALPLRVRVSHLVGRVDTIHDLGEVIDVGRRLDKLTQDIEVVFPRHGPGERPHRFREWRSRTLIDLHIRRPLLALYRPFAMGVPDAPLEVVRVYMRSSLVILRYLDDLDPGHPFYEEMCDMYIQLLRHDIIQAAFSICFYIMNMPGDEDSGMAGLGGRTELDAAGAGEDQRLSFPSDVHMPGTQAGLITTVQKSIDLLVRKAKPGTADLNDIVPLVTTFSVARGRRRDYRGQPLSEEEKAQRLARDLELVLEGLMRSTNTSAEKIGIVVAEGAGGARESAGQAVPEYEYGRSMAPRGYTSSASCESWGYAGPMSGMGG